MDDSYFNEVVADIVVNELECDTSAMVYKRHVHKFVEDFGGLNTRWQFTLEFLRHQYFID